jgi:hypothetical protein
MEVFGEESYSFQNYLSSSHLEYDFGQRRFHKLEPSQILDMYDSFVIRNLQFASEYHLILVLLRQSTVDRKNTRINKFSIRVWRCSFSRSKSGKVPMEFGSVLLEKQILQIIAFHSCVPTITSFRSSKSSSLRSSIRTVRDRDPSGESVWISVRSESSGNG